MDATVSGLLLYAENLVLVCGLLFVSVIIALGKGPVMRQMDRIEPETEPGRNYTLRRLARWFKVNQVRIGLFLLFFFGAVSYAVGGIYAILGISLIRPEGIIWHVAVVRAFQASGVWIFIIGVTKKRNGLPSEKKRDTIDS